MPYVLDCYDNLEESLRHAWALLVRGAADRRSPLHTVAVATTARDGAPDVRTVVLRAADPDLWQVSFHTDARSRKMEDLARDPRIGIVAYDPGAKVQIRCRGTATCHAGDAEAATAWARSQTLSRACYAQGPAPGTPLDTPLIEVPDGQAQPGLGYENFVKVTVSVEEVEWLYLAHGGHRRARFTRRNGGDVHLTWLAP